MKFEWQKISETNPGTTGSVTFRAYVPGGWLVRSVTWMDDPEGGNTQSESMVFVPDTMHSWDLEID